MKKFLVSLSCLFICIFSVVVAQEEIISRESYASYYGDLFHGRTTANGEVFNMNAYTAAHKTLPFGTFLEVTNLENGKKVVVRVNDRGPFVANREIDLSKAAAASLEMLDRGVTRVSIKKVSSFDAASVVTKNEYVPPNTTFSVYSTPVLLEDAYPPPPPSYVPPVTQHSYVNKVYQPMTNQQGAGPLWRIQLGSFTREENALRLVVALRKIGFEPAYEKVDMHVRVVLYGIPALELDKVKDVLYKENYRDYIIRQESW